MIQVHNVPPELHRELKRRGRLPLTRHMHLGLIARTFELSANFAAADASYVGLAEALDAGLLTLDRRWVER
jgi:predicted nucleic acid-binding protein